MPRVENDIKLDFKDVLIRPKRSTLRSREEVDLCRLHTFKHSQIEYNGIPIIAANMDTVGTMAMAKTFHQHGLFTALHKYHEADDIAGLLAEVPGIEQNMAVSSGGSSEDFKRLSNIIDKVPNIHYACLDVANGYTEFFVDYVRKVREAFPKLTIMAGNVVTGEMVEQLILAGADVVKVGIGPGSVCTTRTKTGVGYPQLSAVMECADAAHGLNGHIISLEKTWMKRAMEVNVQLGGIPYQEALQQQADKRQPEETTTNAKILGRTDDGDNLPSPTIVNMVQPAVEDAVDPWPVRDADKLASVQAKGQYGAVSATQRDLQVMRMYQERNSFIQGLLQAAQDQQGKTE